MDTKAFATRTERRLKENPRIEGTHIIGLDMGYSAPKCFHEKGNFVFPNSVQKITGEIFGDLGKNDLIHENPETGEKYYIGEMAVKSLQEDSVVAEDTMFGRNHYMHPDFLRKFQTALGLAMWDTPTDGSDIFLQTGLPPAYMQRDEQYLRAAIEKRHQFYLQSGTEKKYFDITLKHDQVDVIYQPMGTFWSVVTDNDGNYVKNAKEMLNSNLLVFDGGFGTLDKFVISGKQLESKDTNAELGMKRVLEETRKQIRGELNADISLPAMQMCLRSGKIKVNDLINFCDREYPIDPYLEKANEMVREEAFDSIKDYVFKIRYLIMAGGTGTAWYDYFKDRLKGISSLSVIPGNANSTLPAIYSNARGYYMYRYMQLKMANLAARR